jgi:hypothetical protein
VWEYNKPLESHLQVLMRYLHRVRPRAASSHHVPSLLSLRLELVAMISQRRIALHLRNCASGIRYWVRMVRIVERSFLVRIITVLLYRHEVQLGYKVDTTLCKTLSSPGIHSSSRKCVSLQSEDRSTSSTLRCFAGPRSWLADYQGLENAHQNHDLSSIKWLANLVS